jgi:hypothetical protein
MELAEQINQHAYLFLAEIGEPEDNMLKLVIEEGRASDIPEDIRIGDVVLSEARPVVVDETCKIYEVLFGTYVAYSIRNESYTSGDEGEEFTGRLYRFYSKSYFLDYVRLATFATDEFPGKLSHYEFVCANHIVDIVSDSEPAIRMIKGPIGPARSLVPTDSHLN